MKNQKFGIEIEMTAITRSQAAIVIAEYFSTEYSHVGYAALRETAERIRHDYD